MEGSGEECVDREEAAAMSLREWLDVPRRSIDRMECLHVFLQVAEAVESAHAQGVVVGNARPSCFVLSPLNRVSFIESASCSSSGWGSDGDGNDRLPSPPEAESSPRGMRDSSAVEDDGGSSKAFPLKQVLSMELNWYTTPEEAAGGRGSFASDVYRLGVLLFELFCAFDMADEKPRMMSNLKHRVLPPPLLLKWPKEASFCLWLLHPDPKNRPGMGEVLQSEFLNGPKNILEEREEVLKLKEDIEDQELLLDFLLLLRQKKQEINDKFHDIISFLSADIEEVLNEWSILKKKGSSYSEHEEDESSTVEKFDQPLLYPVISEDSACSGSRKRSRPGLQDFIKSDDSQLFAESPWLEMNPDIQNIILSKSSRLMKNFDKLEAAYFSARWRLMKPLDKSLSRHSLTGSAHRVSTAGTEGSTLDDLYLKEGHNGGRKSEWINPFLQDLCKYLTYSKFKVRADLKQGDLLHSSNLVCSLGFDRDKEFFATAGVNRRIKVFECDVILNEDRDIYYPVAELMSRSKLSSICWNNYIKSQIASSDFEGVVQIWDVTRSQVLTEMKEHGRRVWSVDFSLADPTKLATGSDDGTVKLWNINQAVSIGTIKTKANVCSVQFPPDSSHSLAIGSADHNVYCYDLRNLRMPCCTLVGHMRTASYVKYLDPSHLVSASTDSSLKLWDMSSSTSRILENPLRTFTGHINVKNFVGLSISDGYIATGSETNEVFVYHKAFPMPALSYKFNSEDPDSEREVEDVAQFVSCVCWRGQSNILLAANSSGNVKILEMI